MTNLTKKDFLPNKQNLFVWLNALFLIGLLLLDYADAFTIVMAYFLESIIIGIVHAFKMYKVASHTRGDKKYYTIPFFLFHYSFFIVIQLIFVFVFLGMKDGNIKEAFNLIENISYVLAYKGMTTVLISILIYNLADYYINFIRTKAYEKTTIDKMFMQPYVRIFIQQFAVIIGGFLIFILPGLFFLAILIIVFRTFIELVFIANPNSNFLKIKKL